MIKDQILARLQQLTGHNYLELTTRGNTAISAALSVVPSGGRILIPAEGGWLHYRQAPQKMGLIAEEVACDNAKINLDDLNKKLQEHTFSTFIYQNPGGYFAEQPMKEIYDLCRKHKCLVILDVSGSIGTPLCSGQYADFLVCSFGKWKLVEAHVGGFVSSKDKQIFEKMQVEKLTDEAAYATIFQKLEDLPSRISFLEQKLKRILSDLNDYTVVNPQDSGFVVVVKFTGSDEKEKIINYCNTHKLAWVECPRYIRINSPAISIEVKQELGEPKRTLQDLKSR